MTALYTSLAAAWRFLRLYVLALAMVHGIAPNADELASRSMAVVAATEPPLFDDDADRTITLATLTATVAQESSFRAAAIGDNHRAFGIAQIWQRPDLMDPVANLHEAMRQLRISIAMCPRFIWAPYLSGHCDSARGRRVSEQRTRLVAQILRDLNVGGEEVAKR